MPWDLVPFVSCPVIQLVPWDLVSCVLNSDAASALGFSSLRFSAL